MQFIILTTFQYGKRKQFWLNLGAVPSATAGAFLWINVRCGLGRAGNRHAVHQIVFLQPVRDLWLLACLSLNIARNRTLSESFDTNSPNMQWWLCGAHLKLSTDCYGGNSVWARVWLRLGNAYGVECKHSARVVNTGLTCSLKAKVICIAPRTGSGKILVW